METSIDEDRLLTSTPIESLDFPHLLDPGENLSDSKSDDRDTPDFIVRLGTSLVRSEAESQYKLLLKEFTLRPLESQRNIKQQCVVNSGATSIRSSGRVSPIRRRSSVMSVCNDTRRSSVTSITTEQHLSILRRGLGRLQRRRMSTRSVLCPPTPSPKEDLSPREPVSADDFVFAVDCHYEIYLYYGSYVSNMIPKTSTTDFFSISWEFLMNELDGLFDFFIHINFTQQ